MVRPRKSADVETAPLLTVTQVCERTQLSPSTIRRALKSGELHHHALGRLIRVSETDLQRFLSRCHSNRGW